MGDRVVPVSDVAGKTDRSALGRELDRVGEQIHQNALHMLSIHQDIAALVAVDIIFKLLPGIHRPGFNDRMNLVQQIIFSDSVAHRHDLARIQPAGLENLPDEVREITPR